jgi:hypothetical protein
LGALSRGVRALHTRRRLATTAKTQTGGMDMIQFGNVDFTLQNLDETINRTMEALNRVRLSVYGTVPSVFGMTPAIGGLAHAAAQNPFVNSALANQFANPYAAAIWTNAITNQFANPYTAFGIPTGLGHNGFNTTFGHPYAAARFAQTNPFTQWGVSPFGVSTF